MNSTTKLITTLIFSLLLFTISTIQSCSNTTLFQGADPEDPYICLCQQYFIYKPSMNLCVRDCGVIPYALSNCQQPNTSVSTCACTTNFVWDSNNNICGRDCSGDALSTKTYNPADVDQCQCNQGFTWNSTQLKCVRDCSSVTHSPGLSSSDNSKCSCNFGYSFDSISATCKENCPDAHDTPDSMNNTICNCDTGFIKN